MLLQPKAVGVHRGRTCVTQKNQQSLNKTLQCENRLQATCPESPRLMSFQKEAEPRLISVVGEPDSQTTTRPCHTDPRSAQNSHPTRATEGTLSVWCFWSLTWKPMQSVSRDKSQRDYNLRRQPFGSKGHVHCVWSPHQACLAQSRCSLEVW